MPPQGDTIDDKFVPGGTNIGQNTWSMMRRTEIFGQDVDVFRPERWLEAEPARLVEMTRTVELVFGYGRWICAGKHVAVVELNMAVVEVRNAFAGAVRGCRTFAGLWSLTAHSFCETSTSNSLTP